MQNVKIETGNNGTITIKIDSKADGYWSKSGKSKVIASTNGFADIDGSDVRINLNVIRPTR